jgi:cupin 2 domain-containing protein
MTIPRPEDRLVINLFNDIPARSADEIFTEVLVRENVRIERIVSTGQSTPADQPHRQRRDEWVLLLTGLAGLRLDGANERTLHPGDPVLIPAHRAHWVTYTANQPTIWLAIHFA